MLVAFTICLSVALALLTAWYAAFSQYNRRRARQVLRWIEAAFAGHGKVAGVHWQGPGEFHARLQLSPNAWFLCASVLVRLAPRELPLRWIKSGLHGEPEVLTFEADLDVPPAHELEVHHHRSQ